MIFLILFFWLLFFYSLACRILRWLAIWQQKEYRLDRLIAFLKTKEGKEELKNILIFPLKKNQIKRPVWTKKIILIAFLTVLSLFFFNWNSSLQIATAYFVVPLLVLISSIPATVVTWISLKYLETKASNLIKTHQPTIIGVSGSYGKTTTKILIKQLISSDKKVWMTPKSHNTPLSIAQAIVNSYKGEPVVILEYASYKKGEINHISSLYPPTMGVFTGINNQHLALFGSWKNMISAETELFESLKKNSLLFYNSADKTVSELVKKYTNLKLIPIQTSQIQNYKLDKRGYLNINLTKSDKGFIQTKLLGEHYLINLSQAINIARNLNISQNNIIKQIKNFNPGEEFIRTKQSKKGFSIIIDDRTSNLDGFMAAIDLVSKIKAKNKYLIAGGIVDLGEQSGEAHQKIAKRANNVFEQIWYTSDLESDILAKELADKYYSIKNIEQLKDRLSSNINENDLILIEGKLPLAIDNYLKSL